MTQHSRRGQRGQLVLIAAILVATSIVGAVVLLNAVHSSPDVKAQTDAQSLSSAERMVGDIQQDLEQLNESENLLALDESEVQEITEAYNEQLARLASKEEAAVPSVELENKEADRIVFKVSYTDPSVTYESRMTLSRGGS